MKRAQATHTETKLRRLEKELLRGLLNSTPAKQCHNCRHREQKLCARLQIPVEDDETCVKYAGRATV